MAELAEKLGGDGIAGSWVVQGNYSDAAAVWCGEFGYLEESWLRGVGAVSDWMDMELD